MILGVPNNISTLILIGFGVFLAVFRGVIKSRNGKGDKLKTVQHVASSDYTHDVKPM